MVKQIEELATSVRNPFMLLSFLSLALLGLFIYVLNQQANLPSSLRLLILGFVGVLFSICVAAFLILLFRDPTRLFMQDISDLKQAQGRMTQITSEVGERLSTAEQALLPIIGGHNPHSFDRLRAGQLVIGSKQFLEQIILGDILADWVELQLSPVKCERLIPNGGTLKNFADLKNGWIDGYIEYTGTGCMLLQIDPRGRSLEQVVAELDAESRKRFNIAWLSPLGLHNDYKIVVRTDSAKALRIESIPNLGRAAGRLTFCSDLESINRQDGLVGLRRKYGIHFSQVKVVGFEERYDLLEAGEADVTFGFETDPELDNPNLTILKDPDMFFPDYHAVPVFRVEALEEVENLEQTLRRLGNRVSNEAIVEMIATHRSRGTDQAIAFELASKFVRKLAEPGHGCNFV